MAQIDTSDLVAIVEQGLKGNVSGVHLLCKRLVSRAKKHDPELAQRVLSLLVADTGARGATLPAPVDTDSRQNLIQQVFPVLLDIEPVWPAKLEGELSSVLEERHQADKLLAGGLEPIRALLFSGPPGVGKTLAAKWLASQLNLPLLTLDLATVMSSFLGKTGSNIKSVISYAASFPCVLLLDEFDAVAKKRDDDRDVGELKRLVTVLLQAIDEWPSSSLLIAATNHPDILDPAVWRRFDMVLDFDNPPQEAIIQFLSYEGVSREIASRLAPLLDGTSFAKLRQIILAAKKRHLLSGDSLTASLIDQTLKFKDDCLDDDHDKRDLLVIKCHLNGLSQRKIADQFAISHTTVARILKRFAEGTLG